MKIIPGSFSNSGDYKVLLENDRNPLVPVRESAKERKYKLGSICDKRSERRRRRKKKKNPREFYFSFLNY